MSAEKVVYRYRHIVSEGDHGSSSWKVAFADFAISMMALFLVLWLVSVTSDVQKRSISSYFARPGIFSHPSSSSPVSMAGGATVHEGLPFFISAVPSGKTGTQLRGERSAGVNERIGFSSQLSAKKQASSVLGRRQGLEIRSLPRGVLISIVQSEHGPVFRPGSSELEPFYEDLVLALARPLGLMRRRVMIVGHADTRGRGDGYLDANWGLAARRAESVRKTLVFGGMSFWQVAFVTSMAALAPLPGRAGNDPLNRRVDIMILSRRSEHAIARQQANYQQAQAIVPEPEWTPLLDGVQANQKDSLPRKGASASAGKGGQPVSRPTGGQGPSGQSVTGSL